MSTNDRQDRVPGFVYLDMDRVKSISSRIDEGYIEEKVEEEEESSELAASLTGSIKAYILGVGSSSMSGTVEGRTGSTSRTEESRALHHYYYPLLEGWLEDFEGEWFHDVDNIIDDIEGDYTERAARSSVASEVSEGDIIRVSGSVELLNFSTSMEFVDGMLSAVNRLEEVLDDSEDTTSDEAPAAESDIMREGLTEDDESPVENLTANDVVGVSQEDLSAIEVMFELFHEVIPSQYEEMLAARIHPFEDESSLWFWALVQDDNLDTDPVELLSKYETSEIPNCTVVARVETITENPDGEEDENEEGEGIQFGTFHHFADAIASDFGFKVSYPAISISPIAIYR
ncbi:Uncharacterized protein HSBGL_1441 [Halapricum desulfuricans]|uniref:Uncharacterized protein n=1 Tax=Halapricum desulfuricans TaxID=2841257 RepID=A0A897NGZ2_9EURY|nr:hypothetical protein [Halapricum desulfuricans]QSG11858.1 Uncharacterized protein HSBGL_1441 [Halapricum desulfuricans]